MQRFKNILCVMERGDASRPALERAVTLAENSQARLTVVDVIPRLTAGMGMPDGGPISTDLQVAMMQEHELRLMAQIAPYMARLGIGHKVLIGISFLELIREVLRGQHDLIIKCPESPSWLDRFFTGDDMHLLRKCPCPVWLVKPHPPKPYKRILAAVDVDELYPEKELETRKLLNAQIIQVAASLALSESAELHVLHAWSSVTELVDSLVFATELSKDRIASNIEREQQHQSALLDALVKNIKSESASTKEALDYLQPRTHSVKGSARKEVPALAKNLAVDCIVMGTVARTGIRGFIMGNTAETILEQIDCSVLALKPNGFVTPVMLND